MASNESQTQASISRRTALRMIGRGGITTAAVMATAHLTGCQTTSASRPAVRPNTPWPEHTSVPLGREHDRGVVRSTNPYATSQRTHTPPAAQYLNHQLDVPVLSRSLWAGAGASKKRVRRMGAINRLTIHHEGSSPVYFADRQTTAARLEDIRKQHTKSRGWGDIGYHYIVDRGGNVWQGRETRYQGAHVSKHNPNNLGVLVLGNFDRQRPSDAQVNTLVDLVRTLSREHNIAARNVFTHQELNATACPGKALQPKIAQLRTSGHFA